MIKSYKTVLLFCAGLCLCAASAAHAQGKHELAKNVVRKLTQQQAPACFIIKKSPGQPCRTRH